MKFRGGGATRKTGSCCDLTISHSSAKDNLSPKPLKNTCLEEFYEKMKRHSGLDPESINADKNRLRLGGRSDECGQITNSSFRHSELDSGSIKIGKDSGSEAGMTGTESNILHRKVRSDDGNRMPLTPSRHSDESQSLSMPVNSIRYFWQQKSRKAAFTMAEVLITLGIIGIVAAMTLPSLIGKYQKKVTVTRLKRTYTVLSQAVQRSIADNGDPSGWGLEGFYNTAPTDENLQKFIETFSKTYIVPYLAKINKIEFGTFKDLGYKDIKGTGTYLEAKGQLLILNDGTVLQIRMSTTNYGTEEDRDDKFIDIYITADINGLRGANTVGKDIFMFQVESRTGKFDFYHNYLKSNTRQDVYNRCKSASNTCGRLILMDGWEIKEDYPW